MEKGNAIGNLTSTFYQLHGGALVDHSPLFLTSSIVFVWTNRCIDHDLSKV